MLFPLAALYQQTQTGSTRKADDRFSQRTPFSLEEDGLPVKLKETEELTLDEIIQCFPDRRNGLFQVHYSMNLKGLHREFLGGNESIEQGRRTLCD